MNPTDHAAPTVVLTGSNLTLEQVAAVALDRAPVALSLPAREAIERARTHIERAVSRGDRVYGVTTGFGRLAEVVIGPDQRAALQTNLIRSHAVGVGPSLPTEDARAITAGGRRPVTGSGRRARERGDDRAREGVARRPRPAGPPPEPLALRLARPVQRLRLVDAAGAPLQIETDDPGEVPAWEERYLAVIERLVAAMDRATGVLEGA